MSMICRRNIFGLSYFTLPPEEDPDKPVKEELIKSCALKKMATLMRRWRKELNQFVEKKDTRIHRQI